MTHRRLVAVDAVWTLLFVTAAVVVITYTRLPPEELYNVSERGFASGLGRALVFLNYPGALVALGVAWLAAGRIGTLNARLAASLATGLCALAAVPGVVDAEDLDAKPVNGVPAVGVAVAFVLSRRASWPRVGSLPLDGARVGLGALVALASIPWIFAVLGFFAPGDVFLGEEIRPGGDGELGPAVHLGDHEGLDGAILAVSALILSRHVGDVVGSVRLGVAYVLGLMLSYGLGVLVGDFWLEQIVKRGWTSWDTPDVLHPSLTLGWLGLVVIAAAVAAILLRLEAPRRRA